jgi:hypothetical protein
LNPVLSNSGELNSSKFREIVSENIISGLNFEKELKPVL